MYTYMYTHTRTFNSRVMLLCGSEARARVSRNYIHFEFPPLFSNFFHHALVCAHTCAAFLITPLSRSRLLFRRGLSSPPAFYLLRSLRCTSALFWLFFFIRTFIASCPYSRARSLSRLFPPRTLSARAGRKLAFVIILMGCCCCEVFKGTGNFRFSQTRAGVIFGSFCALKVAEGW